MKSRYACITALAALLPITAHATDAMTSTDVAATDAIADADTLPTVIVTAEQSGRSVMDTGTSTSVLSARDLENRGMDTTKDVLANAPNIVFVGRAEERRVGKESVSTCRQRWSPHHKK